MIRFLSLLLLAAALLSPSAASAHSHKKKGLEIVHPWTRAMLDKSNTTVLVSMTIKNRSGAADRLLRATTPLAATADIREPGNANALAALTVGSGKTLELKRDGPHLQLTGFKRQLDAYESFAMTLVFEKAGSVAIEVMVEEAETEPKTH